MQSRFIIAVLALSAYAQNFASALTSPGSLQKSRILRSLSQTNASVQSLSILDHYSYKYFNDVDSFYYFTIFYTESNSTTGNQSDSGSQNGSQIVHNDLSFTLEQQDTFCSNITDETTNQVTLICQTYLLVDNSFFQGSNFVNNWTNTSQIKNSTVTNATIFNDQNLSSITFNTYTTNYVYYQDGIYNYTNVQTLNSTSNYTLVVPSVEYNETYNVSTTTYSTYQYNCEQLDQYSYNVCNITLVSNISVTLYQKVVPELDGCFDTYYYNITYECHYQPSYYFDSVLQIYVLNDTCQANSELYLWVHKMAVIDSAPNSSKYTYCTYSDKQPSCIDVQESSSSYIDSNVTIDANGFTLTTYNTYTTDCIKLGLDVEFNCTSSVVFLNSTSKGIQPVYYNFVEGTTSLTYNNMTTTCLQDQDVNACDVTLQFINSTSFNTNHTVSTDPDTGLNTTTVNTFYYNCTLDESDQTVCTSSETFLFSISVQVDSVDTTDQESGIITTVFNSTQVTCYPIGFNSDQTTCSTVSNIYSQYNVTFANTTTDEYYPYSSTVVYLNNYTSCTLDDSNELTVCSNNLVFINSTTISSPSNVTYDPKTDVRTYTTYELISICEIDGCNDTYTFLNSTTIGYNSTVTLDDASGLLTTTYSFFSINCTQDDASMPIVCNSNTENLFSVQNESNNTFSLDPASGITTATYNTIITYCSLDNSSMNSTCVTTNNFDYLIESQVSQTSEVESDSGFSTQTFNAIIANCTTNPNFGQKLCLTTIVFENSTDNATVVIYETQDFSQTIYKPFQTNCTQDQQPLTCAYSVQLINSTSTGIASNVSTDNSTGQEVTTVTSYNYTTDCSQEEDQIVCNPTIVYINSTSNSINADNTTDNDTGVTTTTYSTNETFTYYDDVSQQNISNTTITFVQSSTIITNATVLVDNSSGIDITTTTDYTYITECYQENFTQCDSTVVFDSSMTNFDNYTSREDPISGSVTLTYNEFTYNCQNDSSYDHLVCNKSIQFINSTSSVTNLTYTEDSSSGINIFTYNNFVTDCLYDNDCSTTTNLINSTAVQNQVFCFQNVDLINRTNTTVCNSYLISCNLTQLINNNEESLNVNPLFPPQVTGQTMPIFNSTDSMDMSNSTYSSNNQDSMGSMEMATSKYSSNKQDSMGSMDMSNSTDQSNNQDSTDNSTSTDQSNNQDSTDNSTSTDQSNNQDSTDNSTSTDSSNNQDSTDNSTSTDQSNNQDSTDNSTSTDQSNNQDSTDNSTSTDQSNNQDSTDNSTSTDQSNNQDSTDQSTPTDQSNNQDSMGPMEMSTSTNSSNNQYSRESSDNSTSTDTMNNSNSTNSGICTVGRAVLINTTIVEFNDLYTPYAIQKAAFIDTKCQTFQDNVVEATGNSNDACLDNTNTFKCKYFSNKLAIQNTWVKHWCGNCIDAGYKVMQAADVRSCFCVKLPVQLQKDCDNAQFLYDSAVRTQYDICPTL